MLIGFFLSLRLVRFRLAILRVLSLEEKEKKERRRGRESYGDQVTAPVD